MGEWEFVGGDVGFGTTVETCSVGESHSQVCRIGVKRVTALQEAGVACDMKVG